MVAAPSERRMGTDSPDRELPSSRVWRPCTVPSAGTTSPARINGLSPGCTSSISVWENPPVSYHIAVLGTRDSNAIISRRARPLA